MTKDPVYGLINVTREVDDTFVQYTITADDTPAVVVIVQPLDLGPAEKATNRLLSAVINYSFAKSLQIEFAQIDILNDNTKGDSDA